MAVNVTLKASCVSWLLPINCAPCTGLDPGRQIPRTAHRYRWHFPDARHIDRFHELGAGDPSRPVQMLSTGPLAPAQRVAHSPFLRLIQAFGCPVFSGIGADDPKP